MTDPAISQTYNYIDLRDKVREEKQHNTNLKKYYSQNYELDA